ncbi:MAG: hypothetical protein ACYSSO_13935, partial [Planctomycetota bacterium]
MRAKIVILIVIYLMSVSFAQEQIATEKTSLLAGISIAAKPDGPIHIKGVFPSLTVMAPGMGSKSETGIGALIPWADKLWAIGYVAHIKGEGIGLYE